jgi:hypothetical protein
LQTKLQSGHNRVVSGYSVFKTRPNFTFLTNKSDPSQPDVTTDDYGFIHDERIALSKPAGTVRIFLNGGSALFGAGQAAAYSPPKPYPHGLYSYSDSIAGQLKSYLQERRPDLRFEVVNAAAYDKRMHQTFTDYVSTISRFSPDFVINMDGHNDLNAFVSGTPFVDRGKDLHLYIGLDAPPRFPETLNVYQVLKRTHRRLFDDPYSTGLSVEIDESDPAIAIPHAEYLENKTRYVKNASRFLNTLDRYMAVLRTDGVEWLFVLQPEVNRAINKSLTPSEAQWQKYRPMLDKVFSDNRDVFRYFYDDYLTDALSERIEGAGYEYLDMGLESRILGSEFQLFTDYCHLTNEGNKFVAAYLRDFVLHNLSSQGAGSNHPVGSRAGS